MEKNTTKAWAQISQTHEFIYNSHSFPVNLKIASTISNRKKKKNYTQIKQHKQIQLIKDETKVILSENSIRDFISFCHYQPIEINNDNVVDLNYLSIEFEIPQLIETTTQYINQHNELILKQFLFNLNLNRLDTNILYEKTISQRLSEFINDDDLIKFPISSLYRILQKSSNINDEIKFQFLCKCLKIHGKKASVLFTTFNFCDNKECLIKLINEPEYSQNFDLSYIQNEMIISLINSQEKKIEKIQEEFENYKTNNIIKLVHALYIIPPKRFLNTEYEYADPFDINFIHQLNNKDVFICVDTYLEDEIIESIKKNPIFFKSYDVIIFGNGDGLGRYKKFNYTIFDMIEKYRDDGGSVLMLHDFNIGQYINKEGESYDIFNKDLGFEDTGKNNTWHIYNKCKFNPPESIKNNADIKISDLMSFPYKIDQNQEPGYFDVIDTHETSIYNSKYKIIESSENSIYHYYSENPEKRIADCAMGHNKNLKEIEKKLLFNIIYHLSQLP